MTDDEARDLLRKIGSRRKRLGKSRHELRQDTAQAMRDVAKTGLSESEKCRLAGISRSTFYEELK